MVLSIDVKTANLGTPAAITQSFNVVTNAGSNTYLYAFIAMSNAVDFSSVTYNDVPMTQSGVQTTTTTSTRWAIYTLANPTVGTNTMTINFTAGQYNPVSTLAVSTSGSGGIGNIVFDDTTSPPNSTDITVSYNSMIVGGLVAGNATSHTITLDGSSRPLEFTHNINNYCSTALSLGSLTDGVKTVTVNSGAQLAGYYFEIKEASAAVVTNRRRIIIV
jgi:hypothetical protein